MIVRFLLFLFAMMTSAVAYTDEQSALSLAFDELGVFEEEKRLLQGNLYFSYLNGDYDRALYYLEAWRAQKPDTVNQGDAEVIGASIYLALGLEEQAYALYESFTESSEEQDAQASGNAWYFLAQRYLQQGKFDNALICSIKAQNRELNQPLSSEYQQETLQIQASALANLDRIEEAQQVIDNMKRKSLWQGYAQYNLIVAQIRNRQAINELQELVGLAVFDMPSTDEGDQLQDRIYLVAAIDAMDRGRIELSNKYFEKIRLDGPFASPALLHYGWNLFNDGRYVEAVQPWLTLRNLQNSQSTESIEALLAMSHTMEQLYALNQAVRAYEDVEGRLSRAIDDVAKFQADTAPLKAWLAAWQKDNAQQPWGWNRHQLSDIHGEANDQSVSKYVHALLAQDDFYMGLERYYDLAKIKSDLQAQYANLVLWEQAVLARKDMLQNIRAAEKLTRIQEVQERNIRQGLKFNSEYYQEEKQPFGFASQQQEQELQSLAHIVKLILAIEQQNPDLDLADYKERWRRIYGLKVWPIAVEFPQRQYDTETEYQDFRDLMDVVQNKIEYTRSSISWSAETWLGVESRIVSEKANIETMITQLDELIEQQQADLMRDIQAYLKTLETRYLVYLAQSRLALARLYDDAIQRDALNEPEKGGQR